MAFIRDDERAKAIQKALPGGRQVMPAPGGAGGVVMPSAGGAGARAEAMPGSTGARAPLLADYLRAAGGRTMGEKALGATEAQGAALQAGQVGFNEQGQVGVNIQTGRGLTPAQQTVLGGGVRMAPGKGGVIAGTEAGEMTTRQMGFAPSGARLTAEQAQQKAEAVQSTARAAGQPGGAQAILQQQFGQGQQYTSGEQMLDAALLGATEGRRLEALSKKYGNLYDVMTGRIGQARSAFEKEQEGYEVKPSEAKVLQAVGAGGVMTGKAAGSRPRPAGEQTSTITDETAAAMLGMTVDEYIAAGRPSPGR